MRGVQQSGHPRSPFVLRHRQRPDDDHGLDAPQIVRERGKRFLGGLPHAQFQPAPGQRSGQRTAARTTGCPSGGLPADRSARPGA